MCVFHRFVSILYLFLFLFPFSILTHSCLVTYSQRTLQYAYMTLSLY